MSPDGDVTMNESEQKRIIAGGLIFMDAIRMMGIVKCFGPVRANDGID